MIAKTDIVARYRGGPKGKAHPGSIVRLPHDVVMGTLNVRRRAGSYEVANLMTGSGGAYADRIAVVDPSCPGLCYSLRIADLEVVR